MNCRNSLTSTRRSARNATVAADGASRRIRTPRRRYVYSQIPQPCPGPSRDAGLFLKTLSGPERGARALSVSGFDNFIDFLLSVLRARFRWNLPVTFIPFFRSPPLSLQLADLIFP